MSHAEILLALVIAAAVIWCWRRNRGGRSQRGTLPRNRVRAMNARLHLRLRPGRGHATLFALWLQWGRFAAFRKSRRARPSLSPWQRAARSDGCSILLGRAQYRHALRLPLEEHALIVGPPRTGKTGLLADIILHYPGPVLSTTSKADVFELTSGVRQSAGPVEQFNPQRVGGWGSTFGWNCVEGCEDQQVAIRRADAFTTAVSLDGTEDSSFWTSKASSYLRALMHAAAILGGDMRLVVEWALGSAQAAEGALAARESSAQWGVELGELRSEAQKTAATIRMVLSRALAFCTDPALLQSVLPGPGQSLDMEEFLRSSGTLYMIARESDDSPVAPLFAALANELHWTAAQMGSQMPAGRLDPPFLMALDEVTQICPVPLPTWAADSGGVGIQLVTVCHGEAQLAHRWKDHGKQVILDTAGCLMVLRGVKDTGTLETAGKLCGQVAYTEHGQEHQSRHNVMEPDMIRQLPPGRALLIRGGTAPVIAKLPRAWKDRAYKRARRRGTEVARLAPAALAASAPRPWSVTAEPVARLRPAGDLTAAGSPEVVDVLGLASGSNGNGHAGAYPWDKQ